VIETGRANAVAAPESESARMLATLQSIDPGWHQVLEASGLGCSCRAKVNYGQASEMFNTSMYRSSA